MNNEQQRIKQLEELLEAKTLQLREVTQELDDLSFAVSHDLKAPVRAIAGFVGILNEDEAERVSSEGKRVIGVIQKNTQKLSAMLNEIVAYSAISKKNISLQPVNMQRLVAEVSASIMSAKEQQVITFSTGGLLPCTADGNMIRQVLINLFNMALLYAEKNGFTQLLITSAIQDDQVVYCLQVSNCVTGESAARRQLDALNSEMLRRESLEGNGTGAAFVKRVLFKHRGHFWIQAVPGHECSFNFSVPA